MISNQSNREKIQPDAGNTQTSFPLLRSAVGGVLMGLANLVPGISGGTMILVMGLYEEFIRSLAEVSRLHWTKRNLLFLGVVGGAAMVAIATLAGTLSRAVTLHPSAMFSLFIGLTLGGAPLLIKMLKGWSAVSMGGFALGLGLMLLIAATKHEPPNKAAIREAAERGQLVVQPAYARDLGAGALGMSAMILPGISGAYMFLVLNRYEAILAAVSLAKSYVLSAGQSGQATAFLRVLIPTAIGALFALGALSNLLKWMLRRHEKLTLGALLGFLLGSVVGIWPFDAASEVGDYYVGALLAAAGFVSTFFLSRLNR